MSENSNSQVLVLSREEILNKVDIVTELVAVPEWGGSVYVKAMNGKERDAFEASVMIQNGKKQTLNMENVRAKLCSLTICDVEGKRLFSSADLLKLSEKSAAALTRVFLVAQKLSGLGDEQIEELTEGLEKNPFAASASDLL